jgi:uncharacterized protein YndB with AHSA1/START domain
MGDQWGATIRTERTAHYAVAPEVVWDRLSRIDEYRDWWPWLRQFDADGLVDGARWRCRVQPPLPYRVSFDLVLHDVVPHRSVAARVAGDIEGVARIELNQRDDLGGGTDLVLVARLVPASRFLRTLNRTAGPVARFGHDQVIDRALDQFRDHAL